MGDLFLFQHYKIIQRFIHILSALVLIVSCACIFWLYQHGYLTNQEKIQALIGQDKVWGAIIFTIFQMMQVVVPIVPASLTMMLAVMTFHPFAGVLTSCIGIIIGTMILFLLTQRSHTEKVRILDCWTQIFYRDFHHLHASTFCPCRLTGYVSSSQ